MFQKIKKIIFYIIPIALLVVGGYTIFIRDNIISSKWYLVTVFISFALACAALLFVALKDKMSKQKSGKILMILVLTMIIFQILSLPIVNLYSQSLPIWPPRGTIYQLPGARSSIAQNDVGLLFKYYLSDKTLYSDENYPLNSHNGFLFITDEYEYVQKNYPVLTNKQSDEFLAQYEKSLYGVFVQQDPKLKIDSFMIYLYTDMTAKDIVMLKDELGQWFVMPKELFEEAFDE